ncbi:BppU family phage baseplate upper protein [Enterococcus devriesei]|uniref:BppU family phage baseplate upper protein n=1 Tax=Enterococcus devriesei TaxID=319970 RepID=UPI0028AD074C|nr:BppU family phage baseplate upper protein [Enterococcus devriesei]
MTIRKVADIIIRASPNGRSTVSGSGIKFYSYDKNSAAIDFHIQDQDGTPTDLLNVDIKLLILTKESDEWKKFTAFDGPEIISEMNGHARYVIPDKLRGYQGIVQGYIYLDFKDDSRTDECYFEFTIERSKIEEEFEHAGEYYIKEIKDSIDETIAELKKYAAEKLKEYEAQLSKLNTQITNTKALADSLASQTTAIQIKQAEILKLIADNNVATKADLEEAKKESSANVVDQIIGKENVQKDLTLSFVNKIADSDIENPNIARVQSSTNLLVPSDAGWLKFTQARYEGISELTGETVFTVSGKVDSYQQNAFSFNVITELTKFLGDKFFSYLGAYTNSQKVAVARGIISQRLFNLHGYGQSTAGYKLTLCAWNTQAYAWQDPVYHTYSTVNKLSILNTDVSAYIDDDGWMGFLVYAEKDAAINGSKLYIDYVELELKLDLSANAHIKSMIATNHVQNLASQTEAEAGTDNSKSMTPLGTAQQIEKKAVTVASNQTIGGIKNFKDGLLLDGKTVITRQNADATYAVNSTGASLWTGISTLNENHTVTPTKKMSECQNGWLLVFAPYNGSTAQNYDVTTVFVPKGHTRLSIVQIFNGSNWTQKRYQCSDSTITGHSSNVGTEQIKASLIEVREV